MFLTGSKRSSSLENPAATTSYRRIAAQDTAGGVLRKLFLFLCLSLFLNAHAAELQEQPLGSLPDLLTKFRGYHLSQNGLNLATAMRDGSSEVVVSLAERGPPFDRILPRSIRWIENRLVYLAYKESEYFLVDGKSTTRLPGNPVETVFDRPLAALDGKHYVLFVAQEKGIAAWADGKPSKPQFERILFVPKLRSSQSALLYAVTKDCSQRIQGHSPSSRTRWTTVSGLSSSPDAGNVYVWGDIKGRRILQKNGKTIFEGSFTKLQIDLAGEYWAALVDESSETGERSALVVNGKTVKQIEAPPVLQELYVAASGNAWAWLTFNDDSSAAVLRLPGKQDETISGYTHESFIFSENGQRFAYSLEENGKRRWKVDGTLVSDRSSEQTRSFLLASNGAFAYIAVGDGGD